GMEVAVSSDAEPHRKLKGHIGFISPTAEFTPKSVETPELRTDLVYRMRIIVDEPDPGLRQGMPVTVQITTGGARDAALLVRPRRGAECGRPRRTVES